MKGHGFTLIELMIVMVIMGILAVIGVTAFMSSQIKGRDVRRKGDLRAIASALELYYNDKGQYPLSNGNAQILGCETYTGSVCIVGKPIVDSHGTIYMALLPTDPVSNHWYNYRSQNGKQFQLYAYLENNQDPQKITPSVVVSCGGGNLACNYGVSSSNISP